MLDQFYRTKQKDREIVHFAHTSNHYATICGHKPTSERYWEADFSKKDIIFMWSKVCKKCQKALDKAGLI